MFEWFFDLGATNPEYVVAADDVDKLIAVECIPMDDKGHQVFNQKRFELWFKIYFAYHRFRKWNLEGLPVFYSKFFSNYQGELVKLFANDQKKIKCGKLIKILRTSLLSCNSLCIFQGS